MVPAVVSSLWSGKTPVGQDSPRAGKWTGHERVRRARRKQLVPLANKQALRCNDRYWPAIDSLCTVTFALGDYGGSNVFVSSKKEVTCRDGLLSSSASRSVSSHCVSRPRDGSMLPERLVTLD